MSLKKSLLDCVEIVWIFIHWCIEGSIHPKNKERDASIFNLISRGGSRTAPTYPYWEVVLWSEERSPVEWAFTLVVTAGSPSTFTAEDLIGLLLGDATLFYSLL